MMSWPLPTFKCAACHTRVEHGIFGPSGWICYRCDARGIYDRQGYLVREGLATEDQPMDKLKAFRGIALACVLGALLWLLIWLAAR